jgi:hypothetical protein
MNYHAQLPAELLSARLLILRELEHSLQHSQTALTRNDAEMITRGAARQAELCAQWTRLEEEVGKAALTKPDQLASSPRSDQIGKEFRDLTTRIRHLTRVHCSLLRHLQRSLAIVSHFAASSAPTYTPDPNSLRIDVRPQAGD